MRVVLVITFVFCVTTIADGYIVRPFPKGEPTGKGQEMMVKLRMPGAKLNLVIFSIYFVIFGRIFHEVFYSYVYVIVIKML